MIRFDDVDISILTDLQENGRMTNVQLAKNAGISAPPCLRRLKAMERNKVIAGYHAEINASAFGYGFRAICIVNLVSQNSVDVLEFVNSIVKLKNVRYCFAAPGNSDFILDIVAKSLEDYENIIQNKIQKDRNIKSVRTFILMKTYKEEYGIPIESPNLTRDFSETPGVAK
ncbi:MAG: Lrp/AsnC family transcriptional regulator [Holosporales bacterium]|jgi:DNA-binding Lrp family transcriptional regulator|nr:Lrp/AsnC family transcriptional regulator [Holosporales bacterium]